MTVFDFDDYKLFVVKTIESMPKKGRGQLSKLAVFISTSPVIISQVFKGDRELTPEQAYDCTEFFGLNELEKEYFLLLVQYARAGHFRLEKHIQRKLEDLKLKSKNLKNRLTDNETISEESRARFYSNWYYAAFSLLVLTPGEHSAESISEYFNLPLSLTREVLYFLVDNNLIIEKNNLYFSGPQHTHLTKGSPYINNHHRNWRQKALEKMQTTSDEELHFTFPMSLSKKDAELVFNKILKLIDDVNKVAVDTSDEELFCLNMDWFRY